MLDFVGGFQNLVKVFHNHHTVKENLMEAQKLAGVRSIARAAPTRWGTIKAMFQAILDSERLLHAIVTVRDFVVGNRAQKAERDKVKATISNDQFVNSLEKALSILSPIDKLIVKYQSDNVPFSNVLPDFHELPSQFKVLREKSFLNQDELKYLCQLSKDRFEFIYGAAHGLAYIIDPCYLGAGLPSEDRHVIEEILIHTSGDDGISNAVAKEAIYMQFTKFFIFASREKSENSFRFQILKKNARHRCSTGCRTAWSGLPCERLPSKSLVLRRQVLLLKGTFLHSESFTQSYDIL
jgi:hypothetical protein